MLEKQNNYDNRSHRIYGGSCNSLGPREGYLERLDQNQIHVSRLDLIDRGALMEEPNYGLWATYAS